MSIPTFKTILYATDLGKKMRPAFRHAISIAQQYDAKIIMLHVAEPLGTTGLAVLDLYAPEKVKDFETTELRQILDNMERRLEAFCNEEVGEDIHLISSVAAVTGQPADEINKFAEARGVDLIVMGSHTSDTFGSSLLGSTARKLIHLSNLPVLVVPVKK